MISRDEFLEYAEYVGEFYGTPKMPILQFTEAGTDVLLDIEVQGARQVMERVDEAVTIFIVPPDMEELERRLRGRGTDSEEKLKARLSRAREELEEKKRYGHIVINDDVSRAAEEILSIIDRNSLKGAI
jgi:guanylate kinase